MQASSAAARTAANIVRESADQLILGGRADEGNAMLAAAAELDS